MGHGILISKTGDDVKTTDAVDLAFHSLYGALKIYSQGTISLTTNGSGDATASVAHNLNYAPAFFAFRKGTAKWTLVSGSTEYTNAFFPVGGFNSYVKDDDLHHAIHAYCDGTNFYVQVKGGKPNTFMEFIYILLVDQSESFSLADGITPVNYGFKIAKGSNDVKTAKEYQLGLSSQYKILQYYPESKKISSLTFDHMFASPLDDYVEQASYIDFEHGLGYAPFFIAHAIAPDATGNRLVKIPFMSMLPIDSPGIEISAFADSTRVRIYWWRASTFIPFGSYYNDQPNETLTVKIYIFTENLNG